MTYRLSGDEEAQSAVLSPVTGATLAAARPYKPALSFDILDEKNTAIMSIDDFAFYDNNKRFVGFIDDAFEQIHTLNIKNLILDLRGNDGGYPFCTSHLLSYLALKPVPYFASFHLQYFKLTRPISLAEKRFQGNLLILIDGKCFSSTGHLCALMKYHNIGTFVGSETGGTFTCNDAVTEIELDNSKLTLQIARRSFAVAVEGMPRNRGILPDYPVEPKIADLIDGRDTVKEFALGLIEK